MLSFNPYIHALGAIDFIIVQFEHSEDTKLKAAF